jgi:hypothetical protein
MIWESVFMGTNISKWSTILFTTATFLQRVRSTGRLLISFFYYLEEHEELNWVHNLTEGLER